MNRAEVVRETRITETGDDRSVAGGVAAIKYPAKRKNIPPAGLEAQGELRESPKVRYEFTPRLPPVLRSSPDSATEDRLPELLSEATRRPLSETEAALLAKALRRHESWQEWSGKRERPWFEVDPVALHMHERVSTQAILRVLARQDLQRDLFADPQLDYDREPPLGGPIRTCVDDLLWARGTRWRIPEAGFDRVIDGLKRRGRYRHCYLGRRLI